MRKASRKWRHLSLPRHREAALIALHIWRHLVITLSVPKAPASSKQSARAELRLETIAALYHRLARVKQPTISSLVRRAAKMYTAEADIALSS